jgi:hypothetical protein
VEPQATVTCHGTLAEITSLRMSGAIRRLDYLWIAVAINAVIERELLIGD